MYSGFLLLAVKHEQDSTVEFFLAECHCDPNVTDKEGKTPLDLANNPKIIKLLLKHGAKAANVYKEHSKLIGKLSSERPPHPQGQKSSFTVVYNVLHYQLSL